MKFMIRVGLAVLTATSSAFAGQVIVVGPAPTQVANIQAAVDAAVDGDVILVKSGMYSTFSVPNKSVTIVADVGQVVNVVGAARVRNLDVDRKVVIAGLHVTGQRTSNVALGNGFYATNCAGSIRVQDCTLTGYDGTGAPCPSVPRNGAEITNCADVSFVRCTITGSGWVPLYAANPGLPPATREGSGLVSTGSSVSVHETTAWGGYGGTMCNAYYDGTDGGDGVRLQSTFLFGANSMLRGANGMAFPGGGGLDQYVGWGGNGLSILDAASDATLVQCALYAGAAGYNFGCYCSGCCDGHAGVTSTWVAHPPRIVTVLAPTLSAASIGRETTALALTIHGTAGDRASIAIARDAQFVFDPALLGVELVGVAAPEATRCLVLGTIPPSGTLTTTLQLPAIPITDPGRTLWLQLVTTSASGISQLGSPLTVAVVDSSF